MGDKMEFQAQRQHPASITGYDYTSIKWISGCIRQFWNQHTGTMTIHHSHLQHHINPWNIIRISSTSTSISPITRINRQLDSMGHSSSVRHCVMRSQWYTKHHCHLRPFSSHSVRSSRSSTSSRCEKPATGTLRVCNSCCSYSMKVIWKQSTYSSIYFRCT